MPLGRTFSYHASAKALSEEAFDGFAIGGLPVGKRSMDFAQQATRSIREEIGERPLHVFGVGKPEAAQSLFDNGATSVDSSSYVQAAAQGRLWGREKNLTDSSPTDRVHISLCNLARATGTPVPLSTTEVLIGVSPTRSETSLFYAQDWFWPVSEIPRP